MKDWLSLILREHDNQDWLALVTRADMQNRLMSNEFAIFSGS